MIPEDVRPPISLAGYRRALHNADVAILTPSAVAFEYTLVDGALSHLARSVEPVTFASRPSDLTAAHGALMRTLQQYPVWCLLRGVEYPAWVAGTVAQVYGAFPGVRIFLVQGRPKFRLTELRR